MPGLPSRIARDCPLAGAPGDDSAPGNGASRGARSRGEYVGSDANPDRRPARQEGGDAIGSMHFVLRQTALLPMDGQRLCR